MWPGVGALGEYSLTNPKWLLAIGLVKLFMISITVLAGYRGGFIFPFMFAGHAIGTAMYYWFVDAGIPISAAAASLSCACAINVAVTRTVLATPIVLATLSGRVDTFPTMLVASLVALYVTGDESIIKAARKRWLRAELTGTELMTDRTPPMQRNRIVRTSMSGASSCNASAHAGTNFSAASFKPDELVQAVHDRIGGPPAAAPPPAPAAARSMV